jgi:uncharacterized protein
MSATTDFAADWQAWHAAAEADLADPHGFLAITSLHWLTAEPRRFPDAPGSWRTGPDGVVVDLDPAEEITVDGAVVSGTHRFGIVPERASIAVGWRDAVIEVAKRGGSDILRPRHPDNPLRLAYAGTPAYTPDPRWAIRGRYHAFDAPRPTRVGAVVEGLQHVYDAPGRIEFTVDGADLALTVFPGRASGSYLALFTDRTSGVTTYGANRSLTVTPADDGSVLIDFNRATNLPCAYTDLATCPLPPAENRLPVAITAGERIPFERSTSDESDV